MSSFLDKWSVSHGYEIAYNASIMDSITTSMDPIHTSIENLKTEFISIHKICIKHVDERKILLFQCPRLEYNIRGKVLNKSNGNALPFSSIGLIDQNVATISNEYGTFIIKGLKSTIDTLVVSYVGFQTDTIPISSSDSVITIQMQTKRYTLDNVNVNGVVDLIKPEGPFNSISLETKLLNLFPSILGPDPLNMVRLLPGIGGNLETGSGLVMRGSKPDQTMILYDGIQLLYQDHFFGLFSTLNTNSVKDIRIYQNGYSAKYSGFTGGMIRITSKDGDFNKTQGGFDADRYMSSGHVLFPLKQEKWSMAMTFRLDNSWIGPETWNDAVVSDLVEQQYNSSNKSVRNSAGDNAFYFIQDFTLKSLVKTKKDQIISISLQNSQDQISNDILYQSPNDQFHYNAGLSSFWSNTGFAIDWRHKFFSDWNASLNVSSSLFFSSTEFDRLLEINGTDTLRSISVLTQENTLDQTRIRYDLDKKISGNQQFFTGIDIPFFASELDLIAQDNSTSITREYSNPAIYIEYEWQPNDWNIRTGIRLMGERDFAELQFEPRVSVIKELGDRLTWSFNYGKYSQYMQQFIPGLQEGLVPDYWLIPGTNNIERTTSQLISSGLSFRNNGWYTSVEVYQKYHVNFAQQFSSLEDIYQVEENSVIPFVLGDSRINGIDLMILKRKKNFSTWAGLGWTDVNNSSSSLQTGTYQPEYATPLNVKTGGVFSIEFVDIGLNWYWQGQRRYTELESNQPLSQVNLSNASLIDYHRLDASVNFKFKGAKYSWTLQNSFFNIYNRRNLREVKQINSSGDFVRNLNTYHQGFIYNLKLSVKF